MAGFSKVSTVEEQMAPDGGFPTVRYPNPEDPESFNLAFAQAKVDPCDLIIATDPDADRMGVAVHHNGGWILLNGNQVGVLLADFLLSKLEADQAKRSVVIKTIVTTEMVRPIAKKYGAEVRDTLTGFKYIGTLMDRLPDENLEFIFGFEESYGYLAGMAVRDKDAVLASLLIAQVAAFYQGQGVTLVDRFEELLAEHGYYLQDLVSYSFATSLEAERSRAFIKRLEKEPIKTIGPEKVVEVLNFGTSRRLDLRTQEKTAIALPKEGVLQWVTEEASRVTLRPSGTEPKMKLYLEVLGHDRQNAEEKLLQIKEAFDKLVQSGLEA
jgi:phosphoglucomutase